MCGLCSDNEIIKKNAKYEMLHQADKLEELVNEIRQIARGQVEPHGERAQKTAGRAIPVIRYLVGEWL